MAPMKSKTKCTSLLKWISLRYRYAISGNSHHELILQAPSINLPYNLFPVFLVSTFPHYNLYSSRLD
jgi:hypothetical protein